MELVLHRRISFGQGANPKNGILEDDVFADMMASQSPRASSSVIVDRKWPLLIPGPARHVHVSSGQIGAGSLQPSPVRQAVPALIYLAQRGLQLGGSAALPPIESPKLPSRLQASLQPNQTAAGLENSTGSAVSTIFLFVALCLVLFSILFCFTWWKFGQTGWSSDVWPRRESVRSRIASLRRETIEAGSGDDATEAPATDIPAALSLGVIIRLKGRAAALGRAAHLFKKKNENEQVAERPNENQNKVFTVTVTRTEGTEEDEPIGIVLDPDSMEILGIHDGLVQDHNNLCAADETAQIRTGDFIREINGDADPEAIADHLLDAEDLVMKLQRA